MDAAALLKSQGWRGKGFSLHPTDNDIGLAKPLLLSGNKDGRGVGQKPHYTSDQWWLAAFDEKLKGLDTTSKSGGVVQSVTEGRLDMVAATSGGTGGKYTGAGGLYSSFVRGEKLEGTVVLVTPPETADEHEANKDKPKRTKETKEERRTRREARWQRKAENAAKAEAKLKAAKRAAAKEERRRTRATAGSETKEERRARRAERRARKEARRKRRAEKSLRKADQG
ncbi:hypothetical protein B0T26DRAFT_746170 [Lasiosphaeria miniovina]|uniref:G-patch domain-containing protein n=1 Tax=Lasiosphaeria miniovina TaxID=1954250 RepID=A0AA40BHB3_9PEZI|nr:uncharacterized protein B0T26DRAFT_746170 [Lasiosphaeria miniovina]KAK0734233.1 hypothetical protein B0T26DRAFT_746170 [Lasiosphaeria miniovina]